MGIEGEPARLNREAFIGLGGMSAETLAVGANYGGRLHRLGARTAEGQTLHVNQQGERLGENEPPHGTPQTRAVTYAIYCPFERRAGANNKNLGNGPSDWGRP